MDDTFLLQQIIVILENADVTLAATRDLRERISPYINTLARRPLYTIYDAKIVLYILRELEEEVINYIWFVEMPNYRSFSRERSKTTLQWNLSFFCENYYVLVHFYLAEIETSQEDIETRVNHIYFLLHGRKPQVEDFILNKN